jgi:predicted PurR-regulated permease PerM
MVIAALYVAQDVLIPITLAVMLSFILSPLVGLMRRLGLPHPPAVVLSVAVAVGVIGLVGTSIGGQAGVLAADVPRYAQTIAAKVEGIQALAAARLASLTQQLGGSSPLASSQPPTALTPRSSQSTPAAGQQQPVVVELARPVTSPLAVARALLAPVLGPIETTVIVLIVAVFILMQQDDLRDRFIRLFGSADLQRTTLALDDAGRRLSRYFVSQLGVNASFGTAIGLGLWLIGIPSPAMWGIIAGLLRFVPYIGPLLAAVAPIALAAAIEPGWSTAIYVALLFIAIEPLTGYVIEPLLYGHSTGLSPLAVIVAAIFWTWIWGPVGLILSTPLTLCLVVAGRYVKALEFFDILLGDRPALPAVEKFYQRILADDPDETLDHAERMLANSSLLEYYDTVVLQALKLAADDEARGAITRERSVELTRSMLTVIGDLHDHVDRERVAGAELIAPAPGRVVACVSGRGPFDDAVSAMLAQLLEQRGVTVQRVVHAAVSRDRIAEIDLDDVTIVAISYLDPAASPGHLRYLVKRLRQRSPHASVVVGLWPEGGAVATDIGVRTSVGADGYVGSLHQAVAAIVSALRQSRVA